MRRIIVLLLLIALTGCTFSVSDLFEMAAAEPIPDPEIVEAVELLPLTETYTTTLGTLELTVSYPEGWFVLGDSSPILITSISDIESVDTLESGDVSFTISPLPGDFVAGMSLTDMAEMMVETMVAEGAIDADVEITPMTINEYEAVKMRAVTAFAAPDIQADNVVLIVDQSSVYTIIVGIAPVGEMIQHEALMESIAASIRVTEITTD